jgi:hypothetical protein
MMSRVLEHQAGVASSSSAHILQQSFIGGSRPALLIKQYITDEATDDPRKLTFRTLWRSSGSFLSKLFWHPGAGSETQRIVTLSQRGSVSFAAYSQLPPIFVAHCCPPGGRSGDSALRPGALPRIINLRAARGDRLEVILLLSPRKVCTTSWGPLEGPPPELGGPPRRPEEPFFAVGRGGIQPAPPSVSLNPG